MLAGGFCRYKEALLKHIDARNLPDCYIWWNVVPFSWFVVPERIAIATMLLIMSTVYDSPQCVANIMLSMFIGRLINPLRKCTSDCSLDN